MPHIKETPLPTIAIPLFPPIAGYRLVFASKDTAEYRQTAGCGFENLLLFADGERCFTKPIPVWISREFQCNGWGTNPPWFLLRELLFRNKEELIAYYERTALPPKPPRRKPRIPEPLTQDEVNQILERMS